MKKYILMILLFSLAVINSFAQEMPLVYDVENTGANCPIPYLPSFGELPSIEALPDPFEWSDGRGRISNFSDWRYRRAEIKAEIEHYEIGEKPDRPDTITASYSPGTLTVNITVNGNTLTLTSAVTVPSGDGPFPAVIGMGGPTGSLPSDIFTSRNIAQITFNYGQVMAHTQTRGNEPINRLYPHLTYIGAYSAWSWGVSRLIDGLELVSEDLPVDLEHLAVTGCSFAGKMALFAGAFDERIALTISQESGGGGYTTWRFSETIGEVETLGRTNHAWFIEDMFQFSSAVPKLPYDHHELMAMVAPRALLVTGNPDYVWLADQSGHVGSKAAQEVWTALGVPDRFGFSIVAGHSHCSIPSSQKPEIEAFVEKFLLENESANTDIATTPYNTELSPWINWTTPTLSNDTSYFGKASLISPSNLAGGQDSSVIFIWNKLEDAEEYYFQLSADPTFTNTFIYDSTSDTLITVSGLAEGKRYYWRVQTKSIEGSLGPWSEQWNFTTYIALPLMPQLVSATLTQPNRSDYMTFKWRGVNNAAQYLIQVSRLLSFNPLAVPSSTTSDTVKSLSGFFEGQKLYWRVQASNISGSGPWSDVLNFTVFLPPTDLELESNAPDQITLTWDDNSNVEDGYIIECKEGSQASFLVLDTLAKNLEEYIDETEQAQTYTYRVKAYKDSAVSEYTNEASLTLVGVKEDQIPAEYSLGQNYPNPFNPTTRIKFDLPKAAHTKIVVYNLLGKEIYTLIDTELQAGYHEINIDAENFSSGVYFYRIQSGDFVNTKKMIVMK